MHRRQSNKTRFKASLPFLERLAQANVALIILQAIIIRLSHEIAKSNGDSPDMLVLIGFLAACVVAAAIVYVLNRIVRSLAHRHLRILTALTCVMLQAAMFQLIQAYAS